MAAPLLAGLTSESQAQEQSPQADSDKGEYFGARRVRAFAAASATSGFRQITIDRRPVGPNDVLLDILYASICHSDTAGRRA